MLKAALLRHYRVPGDPLPLRLDRVAVKVRHPHALFRQYRDLAVAEEENVARMCQDRRYVRGDKELAVAEPDNDRRPFADRDHSIRLIDRNDREGKDTAKFGNRAPNGKLERKAFFLDVMPDQMRDDLGVRLGLEVMAFGREPFLESEVILDDPIMDNDDLARLITVRMCVLLGRSAVRRPSRVADAVCPIERAQPYRLFKIAELSLGPPQFQMPALINDRNARRVVSAILELPKAIDDQRHNLLISNVSNNSAHK